jgi:hypothetical protein
VKLNAAKAESAPAFKPSKSSPIKPQPIWMETKARVTACHYDFARKNTLSIGIAKDADQFLISFTYYAHGKTYSDEFTSPEAVNRGEIFRVFYNASNPQENIKSTSEDEDERRSKVSS